MTENVQELLSELETLCHPTDEDRLEEILVLNRQIASAAISRLILRNYYDIASQVHLDAMAHKFSPPRDGMVYALELWERVNRLDPTADNPVKLIEECRRALASSDFD